MTNDLAIRILNGEVLGTTEQTHEAVAMAVKALSALPSADVQPVVRCKDCKNSEHWYRDRRRCFLWSEEGVSVFDDGFCSYGERKTDGSDK